MIKFYLSGGPNPRKVALLLEEMSLAYEPLWVDTSEGEQFVPDFIALNPNAKVPVIVDGDDVVFDSNAVLLYLADKHGCFAPSLASPARADLLSWLMFIATGLGPYSGQAVHFQHSSPERLPYAIQRYQFEARRHFSIVERRLAERDWLVGDAFSIADIALWGWASYLTHILSEDATRTFPRVCNLVERIDTRPAACRAVAAVTRSGAAPPRIHANPNLFRYLAVEQPT